MLLIYSLIFVICYASTSIIPLNFYAEILIKPEFGCYVDVNVNATYNILIPTQSFKIYFQLPSYFSYSTDHEETIFNYKENQNFQELFFPNLITGSFTLHLSYKINNYWLSSIRNKEYNLNFDFMTILDNINNFQKNEILIDVKNGNATKECNSIDCSCHIIENTTLLCDLNNLNNAKNFHIFMNNNFLCVNNSYFTNGFLIFIVIASSVLISVFSLWMCLFCCMYHDKSICDGGSQKTNINHACGLSCKMLISCMSCCGCCGCCGMCFDMHNGDAKCFCCCNEIC